MGAPQLEQSSQEVEPGPRRLPGLPEVLTSRLRNRTARRCSPARAVAEITSSGIRDVLVWASLRQIARATQWRAYLARGDSGKHSRVDAWHGHPAICILTLPSSLQWTTLDKLARTRLRTAEWRRGGSAYNQQMQVLGARESWLLN